jgi:hypothetical protein
MGFWPEGGLGQGKGLRGSGGPAASRKVRLKARAKKKGEDEKMITQGPRFFKPRFF